jgi:hypothetical protein
MLKNSLIALGVVIALILGGVAISKANDAASAAKAVGKTSVVKGEKGDKGDRGPQGPQGERGPAGTPSKTLGAVSGPDIPSPYLQWGGVRTWNYVQDFVQSSTTVSSIVSPVATSTLTMATCQATEATSTALTITAVRATNMATSTGVMLATSTVAANAQWNLIVATTTPVSDSANGRATITDRVFPPLSRLNISLTGGQGGFDLDGKCMSSWRELQ